ncbi:hypothetical protein [Helicobacter sp. 11S03491-1]|uniref:hypothetical protein n=1 Tax=Helicobacter sp. 11S03491-1 TaxID=1476196 RepID=UPI001C5E2CB8|nr:hypothetical protein [Helicobacter sp. 11S03491-1]
MNLSQTLAKVNLTQSSVGNITSASGNAQAFLKIDNSNSTGLDIGNINFKGQVNIIANRANVGNITNTNPVSSIDLGNTLGKKIGSIGGGKNSSGGSDSADTAFKGKSISAIFDLRDAKNVTFTPTSVGSTITDSTTDLSPTTPSANTPSDTTASNTQTTPPPLNWGMPIVMVGNGGSSSTSSESPAVYGSLSNINADAANTSNNLTFIFDGIDPTKEDGSVLNKQNVTIKGGNAKSHYAFVNAGKLDLSDTSNSTHDILSSLSSHTGITLANPKGNLEISNTSVVLNKKGEQGSILGIATTADNKGAVSANTFSSLSADFGNAGFARNEQGDIQKDADGNIILIPNLKADGSSKTNGSSNTDLAGAYDPNTLEFSTLTQKDKTHTLADTNDASKGYTDGYIQGKSSDGDIGSENDNVIKHISFIFTPGTFDIKKAEQGYTGTILGGTQDSTYSFYNAGVILFEQLYRAQGTITLNKTYLNGIIGKTVKAATEGGSDTHPDVTLSLDYSGDVANPNGLAFVGQGTHDISFNFTDNTSKVKFSGSLLGGNTADPSKNSYKILNLQGINTNVSTSIPSTINPKPDSLSFLGALASAGVFGFNEQSPKDSQDPSKALEKWDEVDNADKAGLVKGSSFTLAGSDFKGNLKEKDYALDLVFFGDDVKIPLNTSFGFSEAYPNIAKSSFMGNEIDLSENPYAQQITFFGINAHKPDTTLVDGNPTPLSIKLGSGASNLHFYHTGNDVFNITDASTPNTSSSLMAKGSNIIGDFTGNITAIFGDVNLEDDKGSSVATNGKFYGKLSTGSSGKIDITLNPNAIYNPGDSLIVRSYNGSLKPSDSIHLLPATIVFANSTIANNKLTLNNPGGILKLQGLTQSLTLSNDSNLVSNNTTIIGDIFGSYSSKRGNLSVNLSFDTTNAGDAHYYQGSQIDGLKNGSSLSFTGLGSIRSNDYKIENGKASDDGWVTLNTQGSDSLNITLNNTGANVDLPQNASTSGWFANGNYNIRGTNLKLSKNGFSSSTLANLHWTFANASSENQDLLKTQDGSLITSDTYANDGNTVTKEINDYIQASTLTQSSSSIVLRGGNHEFTFIGDTSYDVTKNIPFATLNGGNNATINLINMKDALQKEITPSSVSGGVTTPAVSLSDELFQIANGGGSGDTTITYNIKGTNLKNVNVLAPLVTTQPNLSSQVSVVFNASFDTRSLQERSQNAKYYTNAAVMGNTNLEIGQSGLQGTLSLGLNSTKKQFNSGNTQIGTTETVDASNFVTANLSFYGKDSFGSSAKIIGGSNNSNYTFGGGVSLNINKDVQLSKIKGHLFLDGVALSGKNENNTNLKIQTLGVSGVKLDSNDNVVADTTKSLDNILAFRSANMPSTSSEPENSGQSRANPYNLNNIDGYDYTKVSNGGSFYGTLATTTATTYTFIGKDAQGFGETTDTSKQTKLDANLAGATINVVDGGILNTANLSRTAKDGNKLNLYGQTGIAPTSTSTTEGESVSVSKSLSLNSKLTVSATLDKDNAWAWGGTTDSSGHANFNFNIADSSTAGESTPTWKLNFVGDYPYPELSNQLYSGTITTTNSDSVFSFKNAGYLSSDQINNTKAKIILDKTLVKGDISNDQLFLDFTPNPNVPSAVKGFQGLNGNLILANSETHVKDITFNFTGNTKTDKIINTSAADKNYYITGSKDSVFTFLNIQDYAQGSAEATPQSINTNHTSVIWQEGSSSNDGVFATLQHAGIHLRAPNADQKVTINGSEVSQTLDKNTTFKFSGTSIEASSKTGGGYESIGSKYDLSFVFDNRKDGERAMVSHLSGDESSITLDKSTLSASNIDTQGNLNLELYGAGALNPNDPTAPLTLKVDSGKTIHLIAQGGTNDSSSVGHVVFDPTADNIYEGGILDVSSLGVGGVYLSKGGSEGSGDITAKFNLLGSLDKKAVLGSLDGEVNINIDYTQDSTNETNTNTYTPISSAEDAPNIIIGTGVSKLSFKNGGVVKISSSNTDPTAATWTITKDASTSNLTYPTGGKFAFGKKSDGSADTSAVSTLSSSGTTLIGNLYTNISNKMGSLKANLSFDTTDTDHSSYYQGNVIGQLAANSSLSFIGLGSLRSNSYKLQDGVVSDDGKTTFTLAGGTKVDYTMINTGATAAFTQIGGTNGWQVQGSYTIKGTNVEITNTLDSNKNIQVNLVFAKASEGQKDSLLKTKDGSLITDSDYTQKNAQGNDEVVQKGLDDYIETSGLKLDGLVHLRGGNNSFTFIGDQSLIPATKDAHLKLTTNNNGTKAAINLINMGDALKATIGSGDSAFKASDSVFMGDNGGNADGSGGQVHFNYTLLGSSLDTTNVQALNSGIIDSSGKVIQANKGGTQSEMNITAVFDQRDLDNRQANNLKYYTNTNKLGSSNYTNLGNANLEIAKSSLGGTITLGTQSTSNSVTYDYSAFVNANFSFYGKNALASDAKIIGGSTGSAIFIDGSGTFKAPAVSEDSGSETVSDSSTPVATPDGAVLNFDMFKGFQGKITSVNATFDSALEDKTGVTNTLSAGNNNPTPASGSTYENADKSQFGGANLTFNGIFLNDSNASADTTIPKLSANGMSFIQNSILNNLKDSLGNQATIDLSSVHALNQAVGYTNKALTLNFIGKDSLSLATTLDASKEGYNPDDASTWTYTTNTSSGFYIHDDNKDNKYNFVDFGELDTSALTKDGNRIINGSLGIYGNTYLIGIIENGIHDWTLDFDALPADSKAAVNIYKAKQGSQTIVFDFGGSTVKANSTAENPIYKMTGHIDEDTYSKDSSYTFKNLGSPVSTSDGSGSTLVFSDALSKAINLKNYTASTADVNKKIIQLTDGTIGLRDTTVLGDIVQNKEVSSSDPAVVTSDLHLKLSFDDTHHLRGSIKGSATKEIIFEGSNSFLKEEMSNLSDSANSPTIISGGDKDSSYSFDNVGVLDTQTLNNLFNGGNESPAPGTPAPTQPVVDTPPSSPGVPAVSEGDSAVPSEGVSNSGAIIASALRAADELATPPSSGTSTPNTPSPQGKQTNAGTFTIGGDSIIKGNLVDAKDATNAKDQTINLGINDTQGILIVGEKQGEKALLNTSGKLNARIGVGSRVDIVNKNENSIYDFSAYEGKSQPVVANIDLTSQASKDATGLGEVDGFDGNVSLVGSIQDYNVAATTDSTDASNSIAAKTTNNNYVFGSSDDASKRASWIVQKDSKVENLSVLNTSFDPHNQQALLSGSLGNAYSILDLRGDGAQNPDSAAILGATTLENVPSSAAEAYHTLEVGHFDAQNALIRLNVDTQAGKSDKLQIKTLSDESKNNYLQVYTQGGNSVANPITLVSVAGAANGNAFSGVSYTKGFTTYTPILQTQTIKDTPSVPSTDTSTAPTEGSGSSTPSESSPSPVSGALVLGADSDGSSSSSGTDTTPTDTSANVKATNFNLVGFTQGVSDATKEQAMSPLENSLGSFYRAFRIETNNLNLRMGELRGIDATQGVWARVINGMGSDTSNNKDFYTTLQAGYDYKFDVSGGVNYVGVSADATMLSSKGNGYHLTGRNLGIGIYNTYIMDNGFYVDAITKYLNIGNNLNVSTQQAKSEKSQVYSNAFLLGGEVGYRYNLDKFFDIMKLQANPWSRGYYVEPQLELIYGYIGGTSFNAMVNEEQALAKSDGDNAFISRVGGVIGKRFQTTSGLIADVRLGLSYINEINTGGTTHLMDTSEGTPVAFTQSTPMNNKLNLSLGTNVKINDDWKVYADVSRSFLGVYNFDYNINIGVRWNFGSKSKAVADFNSSRNLGTPDEGRVYYIDQKGSNSPENFQQKQESKEVEKKETQNQQAEEKALFKDKQTVLLKTNKTHCQGCEPESGYYFQIAVFSQDNEAFLKKINQFSYRAYAFKNFEGKTQKRYLVGPFKNAQDLLKIKPFVDKFVQDLNGNDQAYAVVYEVKNVK